MLEVILLASSAPAQIVGQAYVTDGDTLRIAGRPIRLQGVDAPEIDQRCTVRGAQVACGQSAREWVAARVEGRQVECVQEDVDRYNRIVATCLVDGRDLGRDLVRAGWAVAFTRYSDRYVGEEAGAKAAKRGVWAGSFTTPAEYRRGSGAPAAEALNGCAIKGNINGKGARIYHVPAARSYADTVVTQAKGERWFCSEAEAQAAGWRAPR